MTKSATDSDVSTLARNYDFFKALHEDERNRATRLGQLATAYIGIEGLYIGAVAFKYSDVATTARDLHVPAAVFLLVLAVMIIALVTTIWSVSIKTGEGLADPEKLTPDLNPPYDEVAFLKERCIDFGVAVKFNSQVNEKRARALWLSGILIFLAIAVLGVAVVLAMIRDAGWLTGLRSLVC